MLCVCSVLLMSSDMLNTAAWCWAALMLIYVVFAVCLVRSVEA